MSHFKENVHQSLNKQDSLANIGEFFFFENLLSQMKGEGCLAKLSIVRLVTVVGEFSIK